MKVNQSIVIIIDNDELKRICISVGERLQFLLKKEINETTDRLVDKAVERRQWRSFLWPVYRDAVKADLLNSGEIADLNFWLAGVELRYEKKQKVLTTIINRRKLFEHIGETPMSLEDIDFISRYYSGSFGYRTVRFGEEANGRIL